MSSRVLSCALIVMASMFCILSCSEEQRVPEPAWKCYDTNDRHTARLNGLPYWEDILRNCFPEQVEDKTIDRLTFRTMSRSLPVSYYNEIGRKFDQEGTILPGIFSGYLVAFEYRGDDGWPLKLIMFYSEPGVERWQKDVKAGVKIEKRWVGEFIVYEGRITEFSKPCKWAFWKGCFCVMHVIEDVPYKVRNAKLFDVMIEKVDGECIGSQAPE